MVCSRCAVSAAPAFSAFATCSTGSSLQVHNNCGPFRKIENVGLCWSGALYHNLKKRSLFLPYFQLHIASATAVFAR